MLEPPQSAAPAWRVALMTAIAALLLHAAVLAIKTYTHPRHTVLAVFRVGELNHDGSKARPPFVVSEDYPLETGNYGTDGQQYLFAAHDPFLRRGDMRPFIDAPRYRYGRILLPALAAAACNGNSPCIPRAFIAWNLVFAAVIGAVAALLVRARKAHPAWGLLLASTGALLLSTDIAGTELGAQCFGLLGLWAMERKRVAWGATAFALAVLARETYALLPFGFALVTLYHGLAHKRPGWFRECTILGLSIVPALAWAIFLRRSLPPDIAGGGLMNIVLPFAGIGAIVLDFVRHPEVTGSTIITPIIAVPLLIMMARHLLALRVDASGLAVATALFCLLGFCSAVQVWIRAGGFARGLDFLYPGIVLGALARRDRLTAWLSLATLVHAVNFTVDHLVMGAPR